MAVLIVLHISPLIPPTSGNRLHCRTAHHRVLPYFACYYFYFSPFVFFFFSFSLSCHDLFILTAFTQSRRVIREFATCVCTFRGFSGNNNLTPVSAQVLTNLSLSFFFNVNMHLFVRTICSLKRKTRCVAISCHPVSAITTRFQLHVRRLSALKLIY